MFAFRQLFSKITNIQIIVTHLV